jgi:outer membrane cobalamin receptor
MKITQSCTVVVNMKGSRFLNFILVFLALDLSGQKIDSLNLIKEVEIERKKSPRLQMATQNVELISSEDLKSDACCNLSESFMRTGAVDVMYSDGVSGAKEIRLLGLDGNYLQTIFENVPGIRGLESNFGMEHLPATWIKSIQINKGTGSVVNGYEAITGQINLELEKPQSADKVFFNGYINQDARLELNAHAAFKVKDKPWYHMTMAHGALNWLKMDMNHDGFMDNPLYSRVSLMHRWFHNKKDGGMIVLVGRLVHEDKTSGQMSYNPRKTRFNQESWGAGLTSTHAEFLGKTGFNFTSEQSLGFQYKFSYHRQNGFIGRENLNGEELFGYFNMIYQKEINNKNIIKIGGSFNVNNLKETFKEFRFKRTEIVPGVFTEWTAKPSCKLTFVSGIRVDHHNLFGPFLSPRLNVKWDILEELNLRVSGGRGYRVPNLINENYSLLFNNRVINLGSLSPEIGWNFGGSLSYQFDLDYREGFIHVDFYRTQFEQQWVSDFEQFKSLNIYSANGGYANSLQAEVSYEILPKWNLKLVYKWDNNMVKYKSRYKINPLRPQHKILLVTDYTWKKPGLKFTSNFTWYAPSRVPDIEQYHVVAKHFFLWNAQISKKIRDRWEVYLGAENILNQRQPHPIISSDNPFQEDFDATIVWGPIRGAMAYFGFRFSIQ